MPCPRPCVGRAKGRAGAHPTPLIVGPAARDPPLDAHYLLASPSNGPKSSPTDGLP